MAATRSFSRAFRPSSQSNASTSTHAFISSSLASQHRLASTAISTPTSASSESSVITPPYVHDPTPNVHLPRLAREQPELYASIRPPPLSAFVALTSRLGLIPSSVDPQTRERRIRLVYQACTHPSFQNLVDRVNAEPNLKLEPSVAVSGLVKKQGATPLDDAQLLAFKADGVEHHAALATVGNSLLGMLATEYLHLRYPNLPTRVLKAAVAAFVGPTTLADVGSELGLAGQGILRWNKQARVPTSNNAIQKRGRLSASPTPLNKNKTTTTTSYSSSPMRTLLSRDVAAESMRALIAVIFQEQGLSVTRNFVISNFLNRSLNLANLLKFHDPKHALACTCAKYGKPSPQSRMVAESGRLSISPIFVVGVWSGATKIGEASGSSIRMAEFRAAEDALRRLYLAETPLGDFDLPSVTLDAQFGGQSGDKSFKPQPIGESEVLAAAGKNRH
ncbi:related to MRPL3 - Mitochondrial ribosomal protein, large subunit [Melanopsichium pennsylvanicum]|uniref:Large ribosomal subunit protein mL44 n=2 Tax=Melanopsichium pennsylvanicum TaxID=63383 RepID=A0AAJ4XRM2_9BASI|nr:related to MRPL3-Mitochondrial ribosomal protein, large subunit [Melanopsichium pennsylvanicum 4]SNX87229.1 related to MRPL3 - Mitochondrial ribosomal protein, large subunit [Melanopsichium pennsylvanicum]